MEWVILPLRRYFQFSGRSRRKEFWLWVLFTVIASLVLSTLDAAFGLGGRAVGTTTTAPGAYGYGGGVRGGVLANTFALATFIPNLSVAVRRLHDTDRSGWWILMPVVPLVVGFVGLLGGLLSGGMGTMLAVGGLAFVAALITGIVLLVWYCLDGTRGPNRFGEDPKSDVPADLARTFE